jgi:hypothetical protein
VLCFADHALCGVGVQVMVICSEYWTLPIVQCIACVMRTWYTLYKDEDISDSLLSVSVEEGDSDRMELLV